MQAEIEHTGSLPRLDRAWAAVQSSEQVRVNREIGAGRKVPEPTQSRGQDISTELPTRKACEPTLASSH